MGTQIHEVSLERGWLGSFWRVFFWRARALDGKLPVFDKWAFLRGDYGYGIVFVIGGEGEQTC